MAHPHLAVTLAHFEAHIHHTKNRLVAIPAAVQRQLGLRRRPDNHLLYVSIRPAGAGRWNHHYFKLTFDNEFAIPSDIAHLTQGDRIEVRIHRIIPDLTHTVRVSAAGLLLALAAQTRPGWRSDGSLRLDDYLKEELADERVDSRNGVR